MEKTEQRPRLALVYSDTRPCSALMAAVIRYFTDLGLTVDQARELLAPPDRVTAARPRLRVVSS
jgi:hypothetical protein